MRKFAAVVLGLMAAAPVVAVAKSPSVTVPLNIWWATRPDAQPHLKTIPMPFPTADIASKDCRDPENVERLALYLQARDAAFPGVLIDAKCAGKYPTVLPTRKHKPLSPKVLAELEANNTVQRVTLELHFRMPSGKLKVFASQAQGFKTGEADKFCAANLTLASKGLAKDLTLSDRAFANATYLGASCAVDKAGRIRVSTQTYPIEVN